MHFLANRSIELSMLYNSMELKQEVKHLNVISLKLIGGNDYGTAVRPIRRMLV